MKRNLLPLIVAAGLLTTAGGVFAQHYPAGAEGIRTATLPPPGVYLRDYNLGYYSDEFPGMPSFFSFETWAYINAPRLIWMTDWKVFGADYGMDLIVPFGYVESRVGGFEDNCFGLGDIQIEPVLLSWHLQQFDIALGYAIWVPTGDFDPYRVSIGHGYYTHMFTAGVTWYLDAEKTWALGVLNRYEISHEQEKTGITPGDTLTVEWGLSKTVCKNVDAGLVGYYQQQITGAEFRGSVSPSRSHVVAIGPEISALCSKLGLVTSLRYLHELDAENRLQGHTITLTLTKGF